MTTDPALLPWPPSSESTSCISVRGARTHNLRNIDVEIPRGRLVVLTGVSGSGKSSLAFDTLFAEGQRRYLETLSTSTRQFLDRVARPDVDEIAGLPPTLSVEQRVTRIQSRSTLATITQIHDFLRLLFARAGVLHCPQCKEPVSQQSAQQIVDAILALEAGRKVMILAPLVRGRKGKHQDVFERIVKDGSVRVRVDGTIYDAATPPDLNKAKTHDIDAVIDRIVVKEGLRARLQESVELALKRADGKCVIVHEADGAWHERLYSSRFSCPRCELSYPDVEPRTFSFNNPYGACPRCGGMGTLRAEDSAEHEDPPVCPECFGARLGPVGRSVRLGETSLPDFTALTVQAAQTRAGEFLRLPLDPAVQKAASRLVPEITKRLRCLAQLGLEYLSLDRPVFTLSGGEHQRARLAGCLGIGLRGVCYVLDEPTIGLHPRDSQKLLATLCELRDLGNSVLVVEHDLDIVRQADWVLDLGPGAGREGGQAIAEGTPEEVARCEGSVTGRYLQGGGLQIENCKLQIGGGETGQRGWLTIAGARRHNLRDVTARLPLGRLTCVTGVSGSGKSTLVLESLVPLVRASLAARAGLPPHEKGPAKRTHVREDTSLGRLEGIDSLERLIEIDQSPLGRNTRSNPATASGIWDAVRRVFARTRDARVRGFRASRFSFNSSGGRCAACSGLGTRRVAMHFLPDVEVLCPVCRGARFNRQTLEVKFRGHSVADVLALRIDEAADFFANFADVRQTLDVFRSVGLGYLTLGQSAATLSGGEAQRIKLAAELSRPHQGNTLYVLDEPTTGLHVADIERLLHLLRGLVSQGHTVVVIEHQLDVIAAADWVIDIGPEGGEGGGQIVAAGTPQEIAACATSHTGAALAQRLPTRDS